jgi:large subunit ribosomal protein L25
METKLTAERRSDTGKGVARKLRADGKVPAVLYGQGLDTTPLVVDARELLHLLHSGAGANTLVDLVVDGEQHLAIPREIQRDHIHSKFLHVDFLAVSRTETIQVNVPVHEFGDAVGIREGGVVEHHLRELQVECLPQDVPDQIEVDITDIELGGMIHVRDVVAPKGATILTNPEDAVLSIITPAALRVEADLTVPGEEAAEVPAAAEEEAAAEGEVPAEGEGAAPAAEGEGGEAPAEEGGEG